MTWWRKKQKPESTAVKRARAERIEVEKRLEEARGRREYVEHLAERAEAALRVNGFGASAAAAMRRRHG
ncbi:DUF7620 family protein [Rhodococcus pyridinivorans]